MQQSDSTSANQGPSLMSPGEVAEVIRVSVDTVDQLCRRDPTFPKPFQVSPRRKYFERAEVEAWLRSRKVAPAMHGAVAPLLTR